MTKEFKRLLIIILAIITTINPTIPFTPAVLAMDSTSSATVAPANPTPTSLPLPSATPTPDTSAPSITPSPTTSNPQPTTNDLSTPNTPPPSPSPAQPTTDNYPPASGPTTIPPIISPLPAQAGLPTLSISAQTSGRSALLRQKLSLTPMEKNYYSSNEKIKARLQNYYDQPLQIAVRDTEGREIPALVEKIIKDDEATLTISPYSNTSIRPGKYRLMITDPDGNTYTQEFTWGVLAINTNKSVYTPGDQAVISMAVLDDNGSMICDAFMQLDIIAPDGAKTTIGTWDTGIKVTDFCHVRTLAYTPDYYTTFDIPDKTGNYQMILSAETRNGKRTITDQFQVKESVPFDVERVTATRIFPINIYDVRFKVTANQDFRGKITETVPSTFVIGKSKDSPAIGFDEIATKSSSLKNTQVIGLYFTPYSRPFRGDFRTSLNFAEVPDNPLLQEEYKKFGLKSHDAVDYALPEGTSIISIDRGKVLTAGWDDYGITVIVEHAWGKSFYGHLSETKVEVGQDIYPGSVIGLSGNTGLSTGPHLHFAVEPNNPNRNNGYRGKVNPVTFLKQNNLNSQTADMSYQELSWNISIKKGETVFLGYSYDAPDISPQLHLLGPLTFKSRVDNQIIPIDHESTPSAVPAAATPTLTPTIMQQIQNSTESSSSAEVKTNVSSVASTSGLIVNEEGITGINASPEVSLVPSVSQFTLDENTSNALTFTADNQSLSSENQIQDTKYNIQNTAYKLLDTGYDTVFVEARRWQVAVDADVTIDDNTQNSQERQASNPNLVFVSDQVGFIFYINSNADFGWKKTTDGGASWGSFTAFAAGTALAGHSIWYDRWTPGNFTGNNIHAFWADTVLEDFYYDRIDISTSTPTELGEIVLNANSTLISDADMASITEVRAYTNSETTNNDYFLFAASGDAQGGAGILSCNFTDNGCESAGDWVDTLDNLEAAADFIRIMPISAATSGSRVMVIRLDVSQDDIDYDIYNMNTASWAGFVDLDTSVVQNAAYRRPWGSVQRRYNQNLYLSYIPSAGLNNNVSEIRTQSYNGTSWTQNTDVIDAAVPANNETFLSTDLAIDEETGNIYASYVRGAATADTDVYYKTSTDGMSTWSNQVQLNESYTSNANITYTILNMTDSERIYFAYIEETSFDLMGRMVANLTPPTLDEILKHGDWWSKAGNRKSFSF